MPQQSVQMAGSPMSALASAQAAAAVHVVNGNDTAALAPALWCTGVPLELDSAQFATMAQTCQDAGVLTIRPGFAVASTASREDAAAGQLTAQDVVSVHLMEVVATASTRIDSGIRSSVAYSDALKLQAAKLAPYIHKHEHIREAHQVLSSAQVVESNWDSVVLSAPSADGTGTVLYAGGHGTKFEATRHGVRDASQNVRIVPLVASVFGLEKGIARGERLAGMVTRSAERLAAKGEAVQQVSLFGHSMFGKQADLAYEKLSSAQQGATADAALKDVAISGVVLNAGNLYVPRDGSGFSGSANIRVIRVEGDVLGEVEKYARAGGVTLELAPHPAVKSVGLLVQGVRTPTNPSVVLTAPAGVDAMKKHECASAANGITRLLTR
jgi:hypothetical protein